LETMVRHRGAADGVDGSRFRPRDGPHRVLSHGPMKGAIHEGDAQGRPRSGQEWVRGARGCCCGGGCRAASAAAGAGSAVRLALGPLPHWPGGLCRRA
jgi:hypothetical protein